MCIPLTGLGSSSDLRHWGSTSKGPALALRRRLDDLRRKEVIQPHLPIRLPCYDLAPIADTTFATSPPCGLGQWLRVEPTLIA